MEKKMAIIRNYREVLDKVGKCTSAYLYMLEIETGSIWFFSDIDRKYDIDRVATVPKLLEIVHPLDQKMLSDDLEKVFSGKKDYHDLSYRWINSNNEIIWINCRGTVVNDETGKPFLFIGRVSEDAMRHLYDIKTGLFNKAKLRQDMDKYLDEDNRYLVLMDVNSLSAINLRYGVDYGDELLKRIAITIENTEDVIGAYHVDNNDFAVIVNAQNDDAASKIYFSICNELEDFCTFAGSITPVKKELFLESAQVINAGMMSLSKAKANGNKVQFFSNEDAREKIEDVLLCDQMLNSIHNDYSGFELFYQPQIRSNTYSIYGLEALLRYNLPNGERIFPDRFIPLLEQTGMIKEVGMWVLKTALKQLAEWRKTISDLHMSVNLSTVQFEDENLADRIIAVLKSFDLNGDCLTLELTESMKLSYTDEFHSIILKLKNYGIHISIDDFGKGYSNISYIEQYGVDEIKIDRYFISSINENAYNYNIVKGIVDLAKNNNISLCCEGVESIKELNTLECLNPDVFQGYFFDKPQNKEYIKKAYIDNNTREYKDRIDFVTRIYESNELNNVVNFDTRDILRKNNVGIWMVRIDKDKGYCGMHCDEVMEKLMGMDRKYTPVDCYQYWFSRIKPGHINYVINQVDCMIDSGNIVQMELPWIHPEYGEIMIRSSGKRGTDINGMITLEGYSIIIPGVKGIKKTNNRC